jgi:hypothetical protein
MEERKYNYDLSEKGYMYQGMEPMTPTSIARLKPGSGGFGGFGGFGSGLESSLCLWTWVEEWVCKTVGDTTTCGFVGSWKCIRNKI